METTEVYYKVIRTRSTRATYVAVCLQGFDECDYNQSEFVVDSDGKQLRTLCESVANHWAYEMNRLTLRSPKLTY